MRAVGSPGVSDRFIRAVDRGLLLVGLAGKSRKTSLETLQLTGVGLQRTGDGRPRRRRAVQVRRQIAVQPVAIDVRFITLEIAGIEAPDVVRRIGGLRAEGRPTGRRRPDRRGVTAQSARQRIHQLSPALAKDGPAQGFWSTCSGRDQLTVAKNGRSKRFCRRMWITLARAQTVATSLCTRRIFSRR